MRFAASILGVLVLAGLAVAVVRADDSDGAGLYDANCAKCHGTTGAADTVVGKAMKAAAFNTAEWADVEPAVVVQKFHENPKHKAVGSKVSDADLEVITGYLHELAKAG